MGKWYLHGFYAKSSAIRHYLPPTAIFQEKTLNKFMREYKAVYIKPDREHKGKGIVKAWQTRSGYTFVVLRGKAVKAGSLPTLYSKIKRTSLPQRYIIQKAIPLARVRDRPFDVRVMMMRNLQNQWEFFGLYAKVAGPQSIVTNISSSRGYVTTFEAAMKHSLGYSKASAERVKRQLVRLSHQICRHAGKIKYYQKIGIDYAIDNRGRVWVIEVNFTYPGFQGFARLPDKTAYRRIKRMNDILSRKR
ncbi:hypothetical protein PCCS19_05050 [Paenibacillus sp. CCS19]|uniref:YheC/YheD family protein n=1 Tax=Paenibacillus sp. CCS19 TaxID=3158387 RepID=UPI00256AE494|nr:YheC/YheD family protein [Paenibacillus cellulosilyticus]GMK37451.1 hypothetical protein PCCS19_05050 [Paenibacillus cellulosilyticus]